jgi:hypothetical protein
MSLLHAFYDAIQVGCLCVPDIFVDAIKVTIDQRADGESGFIITFSPVILQEVTEIS